MGMLKHDDKKISKPKKSTIERGTKVVVENQVKRKDVVDMPDSGVTFPVNVRVDNHIRNKISALLNLGMAKSQKELVKQLVENEIDRLPESDKSRFDRMFEILEEKDNMKN